jgi:hypothetical protein
MIFIPLASATLKKNGVGQNHGRALLSPKKDQNPLPFLIIALLFYRAAQSIYQIPTVLRVMNESIY